MGASYYSYSVTFPTMSELKRVSVAGFVVVLCYPCTQMTFQLEELPLSCMESSQLLDLVSFPVPPLPPPFSPNHAHTTACIFIVLSHTSQYTNYPLHSLALPHYAPKIIYYAILPAHHSIVTLHNYLFCTSELHCSLQEHVAVYWKTQDSN